jgi:pSer/pThr/pTyr-binding forkhead associated (FHA) protein
VKLSEFVNRFGSLSDEAFLAVFGHPFLVQEGRMEAEQAETREPQVWLVRPRDEPLVVGRRSTSDICIPNGQVSSRHCQLQGKKTGPWTLLDLNSTNGTFVEGEQLIPGDKRKLEDGVLLRLGPEIRLTFLLPAGMLRLLRSRAGEEGGDYDPRAGSTQTDLAPVETEGLGSFDPDEDTHIGEQVLLRCDPYDPIPLKEGQPVVIGRSPKTADLVLPHDQVSRRHAEVILQSGVVKLRDLGSANGTLLCKARVGERFVEVYPGKPIDVGPFTVVVDAPDASDDMGQTIVSQSPLYKPSPDLQGNLAAMPLRDLLQDIESNAKTGVLEIAGPDGASGRISFRGGEPCNASTPGGRRGLEALHFLLGVKEGSFSLVSDESKVGAREISLSFGEVLLDDFLRAAGTDD